MAAFRVGSIQRKVDLAVSHRDSRLGNGTRVADVARALLDVVGGRAVREEGLSTDVRLLDRVVDVSEEDTLEVGVLGEDKVEEVVVVLVVQIDEDLKSSTQ